MISQWPRPKLHDSPGLMIIA